MLSFRAFNIGFERGGSGDGGTLFSLQSDGSNFEKFSDSQSHFRLIDQFGNSVLKEIILSSEWIIQRNQLPAGLYLVMMESGKKIILGKVMVQ